MTERHYLRAVAEAARRLDERFFDGREDWSRVGLPGEIDDLHDRLAELDAFDRGAGSSRGVVDRQFDALGEEPVEGVVRPLTDAERAGR